MKLVAKAGALASAMALAAAVRRKGAPVCVITGDAAVSFTCSDPGIAIKAEAAAEILGPGQVAVSADRLSGLVAGFPAGTTITFSGATNALTITGGAAQYRLPIYYDAPAALAIDSEIASIEMAGADLLTLLNVLPAAGTEQTRFFLTGIFLHNLGDRIVAAATDGTKLLCDSVMAGHFSTDQDRRLIVPAKAAGLLQKLIKATKAQHVTLRRAKALFAVTAPNFEFVTKLIDAAYPEYARVLPSTAPNLVTCVRADLTAALMRLAAVTDGEMPLAALSWVGGGQLHVFLPRQPADAADFLAAEAKGAARIALSLPQLSAMIANFDSNRIHLAADGDGPLVLRGEGEKLGVLMPCRWDFEDAAPLSQERSP
jgi:DNA polymerase-3 subunit beta